MDDRFALDITAENCFNNRLDSEHRRLRITNVRKSLSMIRPIDITGARGARRVIVISGD